MRKNFKKLLALTTAAVLMFGTIPVSALADGPDAENDAVEIVAETESASAAETESAADTDTESAADNISEENADSETESDADNVSEETTDSETESDADNVSEETTDSETESDADTISEENADSKTLESDLMPLSDGYYQIFINDSEGNPADCFRLPAGESMEITPELYWFDTENPDGIRVTDGVSFRWEDDWNAQAIRLDNHDGISFTVTKLLNWWANAHITAEVYHEEDGETRDEAEIRVTFEDLNYDIWFEDGIRDGDRTTWVYTDEKLNLVLNTENLTDNDNVKIIWQAGNFDYNEETDEYTFVPHKELGTADSIDEKTVFTLDGAELARLNIEDLHLNALVVLTSEDGTEYPVNEQSVRIEIREPDGWTDWLPGDKSRLPGWASGVSRYNDEYVENSDFPNGQDVVCEVTSVDADEEIVDCSEYEDGTGWPLTAKQVFGEAAVTLTYKVYYYEEDGRQIIIAEDQKHTFTLRTLSDVTGVDVSSCTGTEYFLPGSSIELKANPWGSYYDKSTGQYSDISTEGWSFKWIIESGKEYIDYTADGDMIRITAGNEYGDINVKVTAFDRSGEEIATGDIWIYITDRYYYSVIEDSEGNPSTFFTLEKDQSMEIRPVLYLFDKDHPDGTAVTENIIFRLDFWLEEALQIVNEKGELLTSGDEQTEELRTGTSFTITKLDTNWANIHVIALELNEDGEYEYREDCYAGFWVAPTGDQPGSGKDPAEPSDTPKPGSSGSDGEEKPSVNPGHSQNGSGTAETIAAEGGSSNTAESTVKTGDSSSHAIWSVLLMLSAGMAVLLIVYRRKTRR